MTQMPPPTQPGPVQNMRPHRGVMILVFGIIGIIFLRHLRHRRLGNGQC